MNAAYQFQRTIAKEGSLSGTGIHTGQFCRVSFNPLSSGAGLQFFKDGTYVPLTPSLDAGRCTSIGQGKTEIKTVEHLLAALAGLGVDNLRVEVEGPEFPALDGSALGFVECLKDLGLRDFPSKKETIEIREPIFCHEPGKAIAVYPSGRFRVSYVLDYEHPLLRGQMADFTLTPEVFEKEIAPARTFCTQTESESLKRNGFGLGATHENTLVISDDGPLRNRFRFPDECARHKVLDILGDLNLLGFSIVGHVVGIKSGHSLNRKLVEAIKKKGQLWKNQTAKSPKNLT